MNWAGSQVILGTDSTVKSLYNREEITFYLAKDCWLEEVFLLQQLESGIRSGFQDLDVTTRICQHKM